MTTNDTPEIELKICSRCNKEQPVTNYYKQANGKGYRGVCKECAKAASRQNTPRPAKIRYCECGNQLEPNKRFCTSCRAERYAETRNEATKRWRERHPEQWKEISRRNNAKQKQNKAA